MELDIVLKVGYSSINMHGIMCIYIYYIFEYSCYI